MKILLSGYHNPDYITITEYVEKAIAETGNYLVSFDDRQFLIPGRVRKVFPWLEKWDLRRLNKNLISLAERNRPDLCLVTGGHRILPDTVEKLKKMGVKTVLWTIDVPVDFNPVLSAAPHYDFIFCGGTEAVEVFEKSGITNARWLPFACDPDSHKPVDVNDAEREKYGADIVFVGSHYPNREFVFEALKDFDFRIYGPGWNKLSGNSPLEGKAADIKLKSEEWLKIYAASKIVVVVHYDDGKTPCYQVSPKVYEALACRKFLLVDDQRDLKNLFEDGRHLVIYKNRDDLKEKARFYLKQSQLRERIAEQGYKEVLQKHAYLHRVRKLLSVVNGGV